jgi:hypothetical protein
METSVVEGIDNKVVHPRGLEWKKAVQKKDIWACKKVGNKVTTQLG